MRIAIDYTPAVVQRGGIGRYARQLVAALSHFDHSNIYTLFSAQHLTQHVDASLIPAGSNWHCSEIPVGERLLTLAWHRLHLPLFAELLTGPADVYHALDFALPPVARMRRVVTVHDLAFLEHPECAVPALTRYLSLAVPRAVRAANVVITPSEHTRQALLRLVGGVDPARVVTVPLGVSARFAPSNDLRTMRRLTERFGLKHPLVLSVGTLEPRKNYPRLIQAFARARRMPDGPRHLVIAGRRGWHFAPILAAIAASGVSQDITLAEDCDDDDLIALATLADVAAQVSIDEGFGLPALEAMRCGVPLIASNGGALPEVVGGAAVIVGYDDCDAMVQALYRVVTEPTLRLDLIARGFARAAQFTWEQTARMTLEAYTLATRC